MQEKVEYYRGFEETNATYDIRKGISGNALDLSAHAQNRKPIIEDVKERLLDSSFTVAIWVKADADEKDYEIFAIQGIGTDSVTFKYTFGKQSNNSWYWSYSREKLLYTYYPTFQRQSILEEWHLLVMTFDKQKKETTLYLDGQQMAIYYTPDIVSPLDAQPLSLHIGGIPRSDLGEWESFNGCIDEVKILNYLLSPTEVYHCAQELISIDTLLQQETTNPFFKVMTFNIWHGGNETGKGIGPSRIVDVIRESGADIVALQETYGSGAFIADELGFYLYLRSSNLSIMSRYPIIETLDAYHPFYSGAARISLNNKELVFSTNWLNYPIDYWDILENGRDIDSASWHAQQHMENTGTLQKIIDKLDPYIEQAEKIPVLICGDFNSGSHLDWVPETREFNNGYVMPFPSSMLMQEKGFIDAYRNIYPDPVTHRGITWSPAHSGAFKDRIDYIFYKGHDIEPIAAQTIDWHTIRFPSDHAAVVVTFKTSF